MSEDNRNTPEDRLVDYPYKATIWRNEGEKGPYFSVTLTRSFRDDNGNYQDTHSIQSKDLLRVSELARSAHHRVNELTRDLRRENSKNLNRSTEDTSRQDGIDRADTRSDRPRKRQR